MCHSMKKMSFPQHNQKHWRNDFVHVYTLLFASRTCPNRPKLKILPSEVTPTLTAFILPSLHLIITFDWSQPNIHYWRASRPNKFLNGSRNVCTAIRVEIDNRINTGVCPRNGFKIGRRNCLDGTADDNEPFTCTTDKKTVTNQCRNVGNKPK